jgi:hypothetical protein
MQQHWNTRDLKTIFRFSFILQLYFINDFKKWFTRGPQINNYNHAVIFRCKRKLATLNRGLLSRFVTFPSTFCLSYNAACNCRHQGASYRPISRGREPNFSYLLQPDYQSRYVLVKLSFHQVNPSFSQWINLYNNARTQRVHLRAFREEGVVLSPIVNSQNPQNWVLRARSGSRD